MKSTLTSADPSGWYGVRRSFQKKTSDVGFWTGKVLRTYFVHDYVVTGRLFTESGIAALREELTALRDEVKRLKSQPYEMRKADKPDCEGLWRNAHGDICKVKSEKDIDSFGEAPPYHYLGPIPVIVEQQPPRVVRVWNKRTGRESLAIPQMRGNKPEYYLLLLADGTMGGERVWCNNWEEVQS